MFPDGTITKYSPHAIILDTYNRKYTVMRKNNLAIVTETESIQKNILSKNKPWLIHMVACKTVNENHSNQGRL